jgi:transposase
LWIVDDGGVVRRGELTDAAWQAISPLPPGNPSRGGKWMDHRTVINAIVWKR